MKIHTLQRTQFIPGDPAYIWDFFSSPRNLERITPKEMGFEIVGELADGPIYTGMEINYLVKPILAIPLQWKTLILDVNHLKSFTDKQIKGPYALWEHEHSFVPVKYGVSMTDYVRYSLPFGLLGELAHLIFIEERLNYIFDYRAIQIGVFFQDAK